jgi:geranylgeranyl diphosphate synthase type II
MSATATPFETRAQMESLERTLGRFFEQSRSRASRLDAKAVDLWNVIEESIQGGKRLRPRLAMSVYASLGGRDTEVAATVGAVFELLHASLVIHDDVIDIDFLRRNRPNVAGVYRDKVARYGRPNDAASHHGASMAIIAGDLMLASAFQLLSEANVAASTKVSLMAVLNHAVLASATGEYLDVQFSTQPEPESVENILNMYRLKTSVYSFEAPLQAGAILAGASDALSTVLERYGQYVGIAYQIADDILGVFGDTALTGKSNQSDLVMGKQTVLTATLPGPSPRSLLQDDVELVRERLKLADAQRLANQLACDYVDMAVATLTHPAISVELRSLLLRVAEAAADRVY